MMEEHFLLASNESFILSYQTHLIRNALAKVAANYIFQQNEI